MLEPRSARGTPGGQQLGDRRRRPRPCARPSAPALSPWPRWSNATAARPWRAQAARVVVVRLLARARAVQDHDAAERLAVRQEERVGEPVALADLGWWVDVDGAHGVA